MVYRFSAFWLRSGKVLLEFGLPVYQATFSVFLSMAHMERPLTVRFASDKKSFSSEGVFNYLEEREDIQVIEILCIQKMTEGYVDVTFKNEDCVARLLEDQVIQIDGNNVSIQRPHEIKSYVTIWNLPYEIHHRCVSDMLGRFGKVFEVRHQFFKRGYEVVNGTRVAVMIIERAIPSYLDIANCEALVYYRGQEKACRKCKRRGHVFKDCPDRKCSNCLKLGHFASECICDTVCMSCGEAGHRKDKCRDCGRVIFANNPLSRPYRVETDVSSNRTRSFSVESDDRDDDVNERSILMDQNDDDNNETNERNEPGNEQLEGETTTVVLEEASGVSGSPCFSPSFDGTMDSLLEKFDGNIPEDISEFSDSQEGKNDMGWTLAGRKRGAVGVNFEKHPKR